jgi:3-dehydroquinate dehydratase II
MSKLLLLHGINLNSLGKRDVLHYGHLTLKAIKAITAKEAEKYGFNVISYQSNHEGNLVDKLQSETEHCAGIIINPGAFTHYSYGLYDALIDTGLPVVEVHLSDTHQREPWRKRSVIAPACIKTIKGKKEQGYREAVNVLIEYLKP